jgi:hypothetical protein
MKAISTFRDILNYCQGLTAGELDMRARVGNGNGIANINSIGHISTSEAPDIGVDTLVIDCS